MAALGEGWGQQIVEIVPHPSVEITDAPQPIAVRAKILLNNKEEKIVPAAWALAWTSTAVLVYWRDPRRGPYLIWLPARRVRRRESPIRE